ncbi:MAG: protein-tyrosine-phosphatase [Roseivirga sp.]|nr:protein-tyrosine-phosphatase [Roseivirga sp.]
MATIQPLLTSLQATIERLDFDSIPEDRRPVLRDLVDYIQSRINNKESIRLNFICTHNSRRSQFSQVWAQVAAHVYGIEAFCYSGGTEATAFNERAVASIKRAGFEVSSTGGENPRYQVHYAIETPTLAMFSKTFDDKSNPDTGFAAVMTCSDADENCPFIPGTDRRIPLRYEDPKSFDGTDLEAEKYDERSMQIATELFYAFSKIRA